MKKSRQHHIRAPRGTCKQFSVPGHRAADCIAWMDQLGWNSDERDDRGELLAIDYEMFMYEGVGGTTREQALIVTLWDRRKAVMFKLAWSRL